LAMDPGLMLSKVAFPLTAEGYPQPGLSGAASRSGLRIPPAPAVADQCLQDGQTRRPGGNWDGSATAQESPPGSATHGEGVRARWCPWGWLAGRAELWTATVVRPVTPRMDGRVRSPGAHCGR
jgi:hypothetical protein